jgi:hypothetical protein
MPTQVHTERVNAKLRAIGNVLRRPLREIVDLGGHIAAIECARTSQPFGTGSAAQEKGLIAVRRDIAKVYKTPGDAYDDISDPKAQKVFWYLLKRGNISGAQEIINLHGNTLRGVPLKPFDDGAAHKAARDKTTGRVYYKRPAMIVTNPKALADYSKMRQKNVGFGKGGWVDAARQVGSGSTRGLKEKGADITANWITRKASGLGKVFPGGPDENPNIRVQSTVRYADHILEGGAREKAKQIARHKMVENLRIAVKAEMKNLRTAA